MTEYVFKYSEDIVARIQQYDLNCCGMHLLCDLHAYNRRTGNNIAAKDVREKVFDEFYTKYFKGTSKAYVLVSPINYNSRDRAKEYCTAEFVDWLIQNKYGMIVSSPMFANPSYSYGYSMLQAWFWYTSNMCESGLVAPAALHVSLPENWTPAKQTGDVTTKAILNENLIDKPQYKRLVDTWKKGYKEGNFS